MARTATTSSKPAQSKPAKAAPNSPPAQRPIADAGEAAPTARKKHIPLKALVLLALLLGAAGGGTWYFLHGEEEEPADTAAAPKAAVARAAPAKAVSSKPPQFVPLEPFTVNLQHEDAGAQYLQVGLSLKMTEPALVERIKLHMPEIRNRVLLLLSAKKASEISTLEGKQSLSAELTREIVQPLVHEGPVQGLESVLFTSFVIQ